MAILVTVTHIQSSFYTLVTCIRLGTADIAAEITTHNLHSSPPGYVLLFTVGHDTHCKGGFVGKYLHRYFIVLLWRCYMLCIQVWGKREWSYGRL